MGRLFEIRKEFVLIRAIRVFPCKFFCLHLSASLFAPFPPVKSILISEANELASLVDVLVLSVSIRG